ncbi:MAG: hypothetical protein IPL40_07090 [Proteobacteria bacterium]|nr:hypothetical protein [Pseudomonadota bacterium]
MLDRHTQLENQLIGQLWPLEERLILASSVRSAQATGQDAGAATLAPDERQARAAALRRAFNADDLELLKQQQVIGEGRDAELKLLLPPRGAAEAQRVGALIAEENADRLVLLRRAVQLSPELGLAGLAVAREIFHRLVLQVARPGERVEGVGRGWATVPAQPAAEARDLGPER